MNSKRNDNLYISQKYEELLLWINTFESSICKSVKTIDDLKNINVFIDLLRNYCIKKGKKYYLSLLDYSIRCKNNSEKLKIIFRVILQLINNDEIKSRIKIFKSNINNFLSDNNLLMEFISYINYLFKNNIYPDDKSYNNRDLKYSQYKNNFKNYENKKILITNSLKDFYDYNRYKRIIINNFLNDIKDSDTSHKKINSKEFNYAGNLKVNDENNLKVIEDYSKQKIKLENNLEIHSYKNRPKSFTKNITDFDNFINYKNESSNKNIVIEQKRNLEESTTDINLINKFNKLKNMKDLKINVLLTEQNKKRIDLIKNSSIKKSVINQNKDIKYDNCNLKNKQINYYKEKNNKCILGLFKDDKINFFEEDEKINAFKIHKLTEPVIINNNDYKKINPKLNIKKELINNNIEVLQDYKGNNLIVGKGGNIDNKLESYINENFSHEKEKLKYLSPMSFIKKEKIINKNENNSTFKQLIDNLNHNKNKIIRHNSYLLKSKNNLYNIKEDNNNNLNNLKSEKNNINTINYNINNKNLYDDNNKLLSSNNNIIKTMNSDEKINKSDIYTWLLDLNIIKKEEAKDNILPQLVSDGIILCDIINKCEKNNMINEIFRNISSKEEALININKSLDYLRELENFPKRHLLDELIFEIDVKTIWELLNDLFNYYNKQKENKIFKNENAMILNKLNIYNDFRNDLLSRNNNNLKKNSLSSNNENKENKLYNKNKININYKEALTNNNDFKLNKRFSSNMLMNSYNSDENDKNEIINKEKYFRNYIKKKHNFDNNNNKIFSFSHERNLSNNYENKSLNKRYFDYVNELKNHFDQIKIKKTSKNQEYNKKGKFIILHNSTKNNGNLYFNYKYQL